MFFPSGILKGKLTIRSQTKQSICFEVLTQVWFVKFANLKRFRKFSI